MTGLSARPRLRHVFIASEKWSSLWRLGQLQCRPCKNGSSLFPKCDWQLNSSLTSVAVQVNCPFSINKWVSKETAWPTLGTAVTLLGTFWLLLELQCFEPSWHSLGFLEPFRSSFSQPESQVLLVVLLKPFCSPLAVLRSSLTIFSPFAKGAISPAKQSSVEL